VAEFPSWLDAPESPHPKSWATLEISAPYNSSVSETSHFSLLRVLRPGDYAFIGVELKELISGYSEGTNAIIFKNQ
jgi:hypothetical protein